eukprot:scaffold26940_cov117-Phaeocystis_antarctica.AAC.14
MHTNVHDVLAGSGRATQTNSLADSRVAGTTGSSSSNWQAYSEPSAEKLPGRHARGAGVVDDVRFGSAPASKPAQSRAIVAAKEALTYEKHPAAAQSRPARRQQCLHARCQVGGEDARSAGGGVVLRVERDAHPERRGEQLRWRAATHGAARQFDSARRGHH